jgi:hypothetical protein
MTENLKGNYKSPEIKSKDAPLTPETGLSTEFEKKALERLGGSIAFVMKSKTFLWTPEDDKKDPAKP